MKRRNFLRNASIIAASVPLATSGLAANALSKKSFFARLGETVNLSDKIMVFIELGGGNDGLNTLIPLDQYSKLVQHRPDLLIPQNQVLKLSGTSKTGLHPAMTELRQMFDNGLVSVTQNVGYPNQDYSHFRSMDIWQSASDADEVVSSGWLGRMLEHENPAYPTGYPNTDNPDPLAIQIGFTASLLLMGPTFPMGISVNDPTKGYDLINDFQETPPNTPYGDELTYIRTVMANTKVYFDVIKAAAAIGSNHSSLYPTGSSLADQLKIVAQLIDGGLKTPVYVVSLGGFDTHSEQVEAGQPTVGAHADLLRELSQSIFAFQDDLQKMGKADKVCGMTYSEFGRTIAGNLSRGSDHGAAAPLFVFGKGVNPGIIGANPSIPQNLDVSGDVPMQHDFRQVYASVLADWFDFGDPKDVLNHNFNILPIFKGSSPAHEAVVDAVQVGNFPNPVQSTSTISFSIPASYVVINLFDSGGRFIRKIAEGQFQAGPNKVVFERAGLPSGAYFYQLDLNGMRVSRKMLVI